MRLATNSNVTRIAALALALLVGVGAEDAAAANYDQDQVQEAANYDQDQVQDDAADENQGFEVCPDASIVVEKISVLCDTAGQYYYGGNKYRDSYQCGEGDKVKYEIQLAVPYALPEGTVPYLTMDVKGYGNLEDVRVVDSVPLCEMDDLWSLDGADCGDPGQFAFEGVFYFDDLEDNVDYKFKPKVVIGLSDQQNSEKYNLGGANTGQCYEESSWTENFQQLFESPMKSFMMTSIVLLVAFLTISGCIWCVRRKIAKRRGQKLVPDKRKNLEPTMSDIAADDFIDEEDMKRIAMMNGRKLDLIDA